MGFRDRDLVLPSPLLGVAFSIPCESWGSATPDTGPESAIRDEPFSIPCESWGSATLSASGSHHVLVTLSVFPANRGVPRHALKLVTVAIDATFSIPCESWGSATSEWSHHPEWARAFQYSLRIVGFRDTTMPAITAPTANALSVFPANRGVPRHTDHRHFCGLIRPFSIPCESWGSATSRSPW